VARSGGHGCRRAIHFKGGLVNGGGSLKHTSSSGGCSLPSSSFVDLPPIIVRIPAIVHIPVCRSIRDPPHEQLLVRLGVGGVSLIIVSSVSPLSPPREQLVVGGHPRRHGLPARRAHHPWCPCLLSPSPSLHPPIHPASSCSQQRWWGCWVLSMVLAVVFVPVIPSSSLSLFLWPCRSVVSHHHLPLHLPLPVFSSPHPVLSAPSTHDPPCKQSLAELEVGAMSLGCVEPGVIRATGGFRDDSARGEVTCGQDTLRHD
jgi:hypothetical protein